MKIGERFSHEALAAVSRAQRTDRLRELASVLEHRLRSSDRDFHATVYELVDELRKLGHNLTSFDESDDMQAWCPDWVLPAGPGLVATFDAPADVDLGWSS